MRAIGLYCATCQKRIRAADVPKAVLTRPPAEPPSAPIVTDIPTTTAIPPPTEPAHATVAGSPPKVELPPNVRVLTLPIPVKIEPLPTAPIAANGGIVKEPSIPAFVLPNIDDDVEQQAG